MPSLCELDCGAILSEFKLIFRTGTASITGTALSHRPMFLQTFQMNFQSKIGFRNLIPMLKHLCKENVCSNSALQENHTKCVKWLYALLHIMNKLRTVLVPTPKMMIHRKILVRQKANRNS